MTKEENAFNSIRTVIAFSPRDWSCDHRDAWLWGIVFGWGEALQEIAELHRWPQAELDRLERLRCRFQKASATEGPQLPFDPPSPPHRDVIGLRADGKRSP